MSVDLLACLRRFVGDWPETSGDPPGDAYQRGYMAACEEHARNLRLLLDAAGKGPVTQGWTHSLPFMQQTVLLTAVRGPDGIPKYHPVKYLLRWYRRCILVSSLDGCVLTGPADGGGGSFMGPSFDARAAGGSRPWQHHMEDIVDRYIQSLDELPHHFQLHLMHAAEIIGYKHPDPAIRNWWWGVYCRLVNDMHLQPEPEVHLNLRLGDTREGWLARADRATVS